MPRVSMAIQFPGIFVQRKTGQLHILSAPYALRAVNVYVTPTCSCILNHIKRPGTHNIADSCAQAYLTHP